MQLAAYSNNSFFLGHAAMLINEGLPNAIVQRLKERYPLKDKTVGVLGMAFKANNDDPRESLSFKLRKLLRIEAKRVLCSDVYIQGDDFISPQALVRDSDIIVLATPHREYADLDMKGKVVVDVWNFYGKGGLF
jgi:UDP-N-acetyl-D-mannosaminuronic acid dehydrogenase